MRRAKKPEETRVKIRVYRDGMHLLSEHFIEPGQKVVDIDVYLTPPELPEITIHANFPAERSKKDL